MKYLITERQFRLLKEEDTEEPVVPKKIQVIHYEFWDNNWDKLQNYLNKNEIRKNTPYILRGNLNLNRTNIETLGSLVGVEGGFLALSNNKIIKDLGNLEFVKGSLYIQNTNIESLGNLRRVGGWMVLENTKIETLGNLQSVGGFLDLRRTPLSGKTTEEEIRNIPNLTIKGEIYL